MSRIDYGIDAPTVVRNLALGGVAIIGIGITAFSLFSEPRWLGYVLGYWGILAGGTMLITSLLMVWSSKVGKLHQRRILVESLGLKGNETVLDVGCGRGLLLNEVAKHLPRGRAIGIDLWQTVDQSGNRPEATMENARLEEVADRVEIRTGDMRELPQADSAVDVVVASLSIHNIPTKEGRIQAIHEIHRVLKPGGQIALMDFTATDEYLLALKSFGWTDVQRSGQIFWMFPPVRVICGKRPA